MAEDNDTKAIRIIQFSGEQGDWRMWSRKFLARAKIKGYKNVMIGKQVLPVEGSESDGLTEAERKIVALNEAAYNDLLLSCKDEVSFGAVDEAITDKYPDGDSQVAWMNLLAKYEPRTSASKVELKKKFADSKLEEGQDPDAWITELERTRQLLKDIGYTMDDEDFMIHILNNLTRDYESTVERLETQVDKISVTDLRSEIRQKFRCLQKYEGEDPSGDQEKALAGFKPFKGFCFQCGKQGHKSADCKSNKAETNEKGYRVKPAKNKKGELITCFKCKKKGHYANECKTKMPEQSDTAEVTLIGVEETNCMTSEMDDVSLIGADEVKITEHTFIGDTGCSSHVTNSLDGMINVRKTQGSIKVGDGKLVEVKCIGDKIMTCRTRKGEKQHVTLKDVKYAPEMFVNLFSILTVLNKGWKLSNEGANLILKKGEIEIVFDKVIKSGSGVVVGCEFKPRIEESSYVSFQEIHNKFGHPADAKLIASVKHYGMDLEKKEEDCQSCIEAKIRKESVAKETKVESEKGERWSIDVSSVKGKSYGGRKFWLLAVDHNTKYKKSFFLKKKSEVPSVMVKFAKQLKAANYPIKYIRLDNAGENKKFEELSKDHDLNLTFEYTTTQTPQYNGIVERAFATLYGRTRAMLNEAQLYKKERMGLWAEAANTATLLDNITVNETKKTSPYKEFFGEEPKLIERLRTFGEKGIAVDP